VTRICRHCVQELAIEAFPLGRPRADGTRHPSDYCCECRSVAALTGMLLRGGGHEAYLRAQREHMRRVRKRVCVA